MSIGQLLMRGVIGGLIVVVVLVTAERLNPRLAGMIMLVPVVTIISLVMVGSRQGMDSVSKASFGGLQGLVPLALFLVALGLLSKYAPTWLAFSGSFMVWVATVACLHFVGVARTMAATVIGVLMAGLATMPREWLRVADVVLMGCGVVAAGVLDGADVHVAYVGLAASVALVGCIIGIVNAWTRDVVPSY